ncbi:EAL domain-containing protein [Altererythrobacter litoralis]|uniref:EAL domain-containing protein n=1 Tax=Altererythrobacter litoralis TaxID=3113904 RepID=A0ABU7GFK1_9SPHN|nr:EAL domain-containing protein [Erythrobacteraceae bacterium 1XM1-14]
MDLGKHSLASILVAAGTAMVALTGLAVVAVTSSADGLPADDWKQLSLMMCSSSCATIFVLSLLHADLKKFYAQLADRERFARREARLDGLTELANRKALYEDLASITETTSSAEPGCLAILDLDEFKNVNDMLGHGIGDHLLIEVASRLRCALPQNSWAYRLGGDEFAIIFHGYGLGEAKQACEKIREELTRDYFVAGLHAAVGCSVGAAEIKAGGSLSEVMRRSDLAMYEAKSEGNGVAVFDDRMERELSRSTELTVRLRESLENKVDISTKFQPIFNREMELVSLEGLFRWCDREFGEVPACEAIQIAKKSRLLNHISLFVAQIACDQVGRLDRIRLCLNLEVVQLFDANFMKELSEMIHASSIGAARVQLEFSERDLVDYWDKIKLPLHGLVEQGFLVAVDDFGSSNASLTRLASLGVSGVKLDPSVLRFAQESGNISVMRAKTNLAHSLGMSVTCNGISTAEEEDIAHQSGCDFLQGYRLGRPHPLGVFAAQTKRALAAA